MAVPGRIAFLGKDMQKEDYSGGIVLFFSTLLRKEVLTRQPKYFTAERNRPMS